MHKREIDMIIANGNTEQMYRLKEVLLCLFDDIAKDHTKEKLYKYKIHYILYGDHLGEEVARAWAEKMSNKDGTHGPHWSIEQTRQVQRERNIAADEWDFYAILNMMYSDYYNPKFDTGTYIDLAKDWFNDRDVEGGKTLRYYFNVVC